MYNTYQHHHGEKHNNITRHQTHYCCSFSSSSWSDSLSISSVQTELLPGELVPEMYPTLRMWFLIFICLNPDRNAALTHLPLLAATVSPFQTPVGCFSSATASGLSPSAGETSMRHASISIIPFSSNRLTDNIMSSKLLNTLETDLKISKD